jgi:hypothetical protein
VTERRDQTDTWAFRRVAGEAPVLSSLTTLDALARQLIALSGILIAVYFHAIALGELSAMVNGWTHVLFLAPTALLVASLVSSLLVFFPDHALRGKLLAVRLASLFLALGVIAFALAGVVHLRG